MNKSAFFRLWNHNKEWKLSAAKASFFSFLNKLFDIAPEILIGVAVDLVVKKEKSFLASLGFETPSEQLWVLGGATLFIWASESFFEYLYSIGWRNLAQKVQHTLRLEAFNKAMKHDLSWFESESSGNFQTVLGEDVNQLERFLDGGINEIIQIAVSTLLVSIVFFYLSPVIALFALVPIPFIFLGSMYFQRKLEPRYKVVREKAALISRRLAGSFSGIMTVKSFSMEEKELEGLEKFSKSYLEANSDAIRLSSAFTPLIRVLVLAGFLVTLIYGGLLTFEGELEAGSYSVLVFLTQRLLWPFTRLGQTVDLYQRAKASTSRIMDIVELEAKVEVSDGLNKPLSKGPICFEAISFSYGDSSVLKDVNFEIDRGKFVGIVGATGSGKTTLLKLLLGFYRPVKGDIKIGGDSIFSYSSSALRDNFSYVGQDVFLFDGSFYENLTYGSKNVSKEQLDKVLISTKLDELVNGFPLGLETEVGERGVKLSGGQRQRLSIARALLKDAEVIILDEATSAVDNETEKFIKSTIESFRGSKTIISIAHRLSTIRNADEIVVFSNGGLEQRGSHDELAEKPGTYKNLWDIQTGL